MPTSSAFRDISINLIIEIVKILDRELKQFLQKLKIPSLKYIEKNYWSCCMK